MRAICYLLIITMVCQSCVYSQKFIPEVQVAPIPQYEPLPLVLGIGRSEAIAMGSPVTMSEKAMKKDEESFIRVFERLHLFSHVVGRYQQADIYFDGCTDVEFTNNGVLAFYFLLGLLTMVTPLPCPLPMDIDMKVKVRMSVDGEDYFVRRYNYHFQMKVWTASVWGGLVSEKKMMTALENYLAPQMQKDLYDDYAFYSGLSQQLKSGDRAALVEYINQNNT